MVRKFALCVRLLIVFIAFQKTASASQSPLDSLNGLWFEAKMHYGSVFHNSGVLYLLERNLSGAEFTLSTASKGRHQWEQLYRNPKYGIGYNYTNLGNPEILGNLHAFFGFIDIPFHVPRRNATFSYKVDFGLGYFSKTYDPYENPLNHVVSSSYNVYIGLDFIGRYRITKNNDIKASLELTHCSNGKVRTPNLGINTITLSAAWLYSIKPYTQPRRTIPEFDYRKHFIEFFLNTGGKRDDNMRKEVFLVSSIVADYYYAYSSKYAFGFGFDGFYDGSLSQHREYFQNTQPDNSVNYQLGAHIGFRARYGNMFILLNAGHYLSYKYIRHGPVYSRIGLRYALNNSVMLNLTLKAHNTVADFIEWGIGYRINTKGK
jgi:hypothetical protein